MDYARAYFDFAAETASFGGHSVVTELVPLC